MEHKYTCYVTPKGYTKLKERIDANPEYFKDMEICVTNSIYLNTIDPKWTQEEWDNMCYIVGKERGRFGFLHLNPEKE